MKELDFTWIRDVSGAEMKARKNIAYTKILP